MASTLAKKNFQVTILEWDRSSKLSASESANGFYVRRMKLKAPYGSKLFFVLPIWWTYISLFLLLHNFDVVQPQNLDNLLPTSAFSRLKRLKTVYDIADFYGDAYVPQNMSSLRKIVCLLERSFIRHVDATIIADESRVEQLNMDNLHVFIIYNSPPDVFSPKSATASFEPLCSKFTVLYAGVFEKGRGLDALIRAVQNMANVELIIAGFGHLENEISHNLKGCSNIRFLGRLPYRDVLNLTLSCDCVVAFYDPKIPNNYYASPNKLFEAMMCGKPIIVNDGTSLAEIVKEKECGLIVEFNNIRELKKAISLLKNEPGYAKSLGLNGRDAYSKKYSWNLMEQELLRLYSFIK